MNPNPKIRFAIIASWTARSTSILSFLLLLHVMFKFLNKEELGIWFIIGQLGSFNNLLDFGFSAIVTRRIAILSVDKILNKDELATIISTSKFVFRFLSISTMFIFLLIGLLVIPIIHLQNTKITSVILSSVIVSVGYGILTWNGLWSCLLIGMGWNGWDALFQSVINILIVITQCIVLTWFHGGLVSLAIVSTAGSIGLRYIILNFLKGKETILLSVNRPINIVVIRPLLLPAFKNWLTTLGAFFIFKTDQIFISTFCGVSQVPEYTAVQQVYSCLYNGSVAFSASANPHVCRLWAEKRIHEVHKIFIKCSYYGLMVISFGSIIMLTSGNDLLYIWLGPGHAAPNLLLVIFSITWILEVNHVTVAVFSRATDHEEYSMWSLAAGLLNILFCLLFIKRFGIIGVALSTCLAQLLTNNWYVVLHGFRKLSLPPISFISFVGAPMLLYLLLSLTLANVSKAVISRISGSALGVPVSIFVTVMITTIFILFKSKRPNN